MVTRKELREEIERHVEQLKTGKKPERPADTPAVQVTPAEPESRRDRSLRGFVPSRGDEDYLFKTSDPELKEILARFLDLAEELEAFTWNKLETIRDR
jgi:hypothetical protein